LAHPGIWLLLAAAEAGAVAATQVRHAYDIDVGSPADQAYVRNFQERDVETGGRTYRPSGVYSYLVLPGVGGDVPYSLTVALRADGANVPAAILVNGESLWQGRPNGEWQQVTVAIDAAHPVALASRDLLVEIRTNAIRALQIDRLTVAAQGPGFITPAWSQLGGIGAVLLLCYLLLGRAFMPFRQARSVALAVTGAGAAVLVAVLAAVHLPLTVAITHLVTTLLASYVVLVGSEALARRLVPEAPDGARLAAALVTAAFLVRYGLMALPQSVIIDMPYHLKWMHELLAGNVAALTDPHGGLNAPPREWDLAVVIPKSPLFYFLAAPLGFLPGELEIWMKGAICLGEAAVVLACYWLLARFAPTFGGPRAGLWAGFAYAANPLTFRALSYGILPTLLAQWLTLAVFVLLLAWVARPRGTLLLALLVLLPASLVAFPTIAVFNTLVVGGLALTWARPQHGRIGLRLGALLVVAWIVAIGSYYAPYLADLLTTTLPGMLGTVPAAGAGAAPSGATVHWNNPLELLDETLRYLVNPLALLMGGAGLLVLWWATRLAHRQTPEARLAALTAWWSAILPLFVAVNYRVDMIGKHLFYTMVPLALGGGLFLHQIARRGARARQLAILLAAALAWTALIFWLARLVQAST
ncbi:MAG TPA: hypothetical protein VM536_15995, partial [Chloroflexia bacterium]|nr:hypothetical protein [Chloroflexia bacterium]